MTRSDSVRLEQTRKDSDRLSDLVRLGQAVRLGHTRVDSDRICGLGLTESSLPVVVVSLRPPSAATAQPLQDDVDVGEDDERGGQDGTVVEGHDQLIPLELPHLVGDGLHLEERVAVETKRRQDSCD